MAECTKSEAAASATVTEAETRSPTQQRLVLKLKKPKNDKKVKWDEKAVDNEFMGKKKSKCCCIYSKPRMFGESSSESDSDDDACHHNSYCSGHKKSGGDHHHHEMGTGNDAGGPDTAPGPST